MANLDQALAGQLFNATTTTASAIPIANTTAPTFILWNRGNGNKNLVLSRYSAGWNATTEAPGTILFAFLYPAGSAVGTASPISAFTSGTIQQAKLGLGAISVAAFGTAATLTTAGTVYATSGMSHLTTTGTATFGSFTYDYDFKDQIIVPPNCAWYTVASAATASTYNQSIFWYEIPA